MSLIEDMITPWSVLCNFSQTWLQYVISIKKDCSPDGLTHSLYWNANSSAINQYKYMSSLSIDNHAVFLIQFGINLHEWVFQKAQIVWAASVTAISGFWKTQVTY